jgi:cytochrome P450
MIRGVIQGALTRRQLRKRHAAIRALDEKAIRKFTPNAPVGIVFWAGVHKARLALRDATEAEKAESLAWLEAHGISPLNWERPTHTGGHA